MIHTVSPNFREVIAYCEPMFIGEGNPDSKILIIGKEIGGRCPANANDIITNSLRDAQRNIESWTNPVGYPLSMIKADVFKHGRNPTWSNYQKLVGSIIGKDLGIDNYDFLDYCFITEMSGIQLPNSDFIETLSVEEYELLKIRRLDSIRKRMELFMLPFFRSFPIVIMACGHYPHQFGINIESTFDVKWSGKTETVSKGNFYNVHYADERVLIHTRQMSAGVSDALISEIGNLCVPIYHKSI